MENVSKFYLKISILGIMLVISCTPLTSIIGESQEQPTMSNHSNVPGIARYWPEDEALINGFVQVCPSAGVGHISYQSPPHAEEAGVDICLGACDNEDVLTIHSLDEYSNFFMDMTIDGDHAHHIVTNQGKALTDIRLRSVTGVQANTRTIGANFMFQSGGHTDLEVYDQCCAYHPPLDCYAQGLGTTSQFVEITLPFYIVESGTIEIDIDLYTLGTFEEKFVTGEWEITDTEYGGTYTIEGNDVLFDYQTGPIIARGPDFPYYFIASFEITSFLFNAETSCGCGQSCFFSGDGITNDNFNICIDFLD